MFLAIGLLLFIICTVLHKYRKLWPLKQGIFSLTLTKQQEEDSHRTRLEILLTIIPAGHEYPQQWHHMDISLLTKPSCHCWSPLSHSSSAGLADRGREQLLIFVQCCLVPLQRFRHWQDTESCLLHVTVDTYPVLVMLIYWCLSYSSSGWWCLASSISSRRYMDKKCYIWAQYTFLISILEMQAVGGPSAFTPLKQNMTKLSLQTTWFFRAWSSFWKVKNC